MMILKPTKHGLEDVACTGCGKDICPLPLRHGGEGPVFLPRPHKNCLHCRNRKAAGRARHDLPKAAAAYPVLSA